MFFDSVVVVFQDGQPSVLELGLFFHLPSSYLVDDLVEMWHPMESIINQGDFGSSFLSRIDVRAPRIGSDGFDVLPLFFWPWTAEVTLDINDFPPFHQIKPAPWVGLQRIVASLSFFLMAFSSQRMGNGGASKQQ